MPPVVTLDEQSGWLGNQATLSVAAVLDVTHATDCPGVGNRNRGEANLDGGPTYHMARR